MRRTISVALIASAVLVSACAAPSSRPDLPPSASDLVLLKSMRLCDQKDEALKRWTGLPVQRTAWGSGEEIGIPGNRSESGAEESFFFDEDGLLVGALFAFPTGLPLKPYPVLRDTLSQLKPTLEFYLSLTTVPDRTNLDTSGLYRTGDEKTTTEYIVQRGSSPTLLLASIALDPYASLLSAYRPEFLARGGKGDKSKSAQPASPKSPSAAAFPSLQQFARGETAYFASCGTRDMDRAAAAYEKAIAQGIPDKVQLAEAHHRLGLALAGKGQLTQARAEIEQSLSVRPNSPDVLNSLGTIHLKLGDRDKAIASLERAITLRPNYPLARYNLGEAYEPVNSKLAIEQYETYLALVEGVPEERERMAKARERIRMLKR